MKHPRIGSSFQSLLEESGIREEVQELVQRRVLARQIAEAMKQRGIGKVEMAQRMRTTRTQIERLLDPTYTKVRLDILQRAARAVGRRLKVELV